LEYRNKIIKKNVADEAQIQPLGVNFIQTGFKRSGVLSRIESMSEMVQFAEANQTGSTTRTNLRGLFD